MWELQFFLEAEWPQNSLWRAGRACEGTLQRVVLWRVWCLFDISVAFLAFLAGAAFPLSERLGMVVRMLQADGQKAPSRKALRGSLSGKRGSCFGEGCTRGMVWLPKQASVLSFHFCSVSSPQMPVCKQPGGMGSFVRQEMCPIMHLAPGNPWFLGIIVRQVVTKGWLCLRAAAWQTAERSTDKVTLWFWKQDPLFVLKHIASVTLQVPQTCPVWKCRNRLFAIFSTELRFCWNKEYQSKARRPHSFGVVDFTSIFCLKACADRASGENSRGECGCVRAATWICIPVRLVSAEVKFSSSREDPPAPRD